MANQNHRNDNPWRAVGFVSAIGADLIVCMAAGYWIGDWLRGDGGPGWIIAGVMIGLLVGIASVILLIKRISS